MCLLAVASCHAASLLFGESESVISPDPAPQGCLAPTAISPEPHRLNGQVIDTHRRTHPLSAYLSISLPLDRPHSHIKATFPWSLLVSQRESLTSLYAQ